MSKQAVLFAGLLAGLVPLALVWHGRAADEIPRTKQRTANAQARVDASREVLQIWNERESAPVLPGEARAEAMKQGTVGCEFVYRWSVRCMEAERDLTQTPAGQIKAIEGHLQRMASMDDGEQRRLESSGGDKLRALAAEFYRLEAEDWLDNAKAGRK